MKKIFIAIALVTIAGCFKDPKEWVTGTVVSGPSCDPTAAMVQLDRPDASIYPFLCRDAPATTSPCRNSIYILHMPAALSTPGTRIKFSSWSDLGVGCSSFSFNAHYLEVHGLSGL
ncbi:MAG TPA: hypothetical protein VNR87_07140 [Flavisolibacter sp.]|nr:hypothetical protein [Flavisolibacter sp.]